MHNYKNLTHMPVHIADVERSVSVYKNIVTEHQTSLTKDNVRKLLITHCYYKRSNSEQLGIWQPMLQDSNNRGQEKDT